MMPYDCEDDFKHWSDRKGFFSLKNWNRASKILSEHLNLKDTEYLGWDRHDRTYMPKHWGGADGRGRQSKEASREKQGGRELRTRWRPCLGFLGLFQFCWCWGMFTHLSPGGAWWDIYLFPSYLNLSKKFLFFLSNLKVLFRWRALTSKMN